MIKIFQVRLVLSNDCLFLFQYFFFQEKPSFLDLNAIKDITVKAGKDFEIHIPFKANPKPQAQFLIGEKELDADDRVNIKVNS